MGHLAGARILFVGSNPLLASKVPCLHDEAITSAARDDVLSPTTMARSTTARYLAS